MREGEREEEREKGKQGGRRKVREKGEVEWIDNWDSVLLDTYICTQYMYIDVYTTVGECSLSLSLTPCLPHTQHLIK